MFLVYNLNIITYRHDSFLFNYHATIINQQFNHHFSRFTRNRYTPKVLKTECFQESMIVEKTSIMPTIIPHKY